MSVLAQVGNGYFLYTKGADNKMLPCIKWTDQQDKRCLVDHLYQFACDGLRTLVMGQKQIDESESNAIMNRIHEIQKKGGSDKDKLFAELYEEHEKDLEFIGASAIEDKLQDQVPETIAKLMQANIRVWVLTGDKQETAVEIAKSCKLIQQGFNVKTLTIKMEEQEQENEESKNDPQKNEESKNNPQKNEESKNNPQENEESKNNSQAVNRDYKGELMTEMRKLQEEVFYEAQVEDREKVLEMDFKDLVLEKPMTIVIDGPTLSLILGDPDMEKLFFEVGIFSKSVVC